MKLDKISFVVWLSIVWGSIAVQSTLLMSDLILLIHENFTRAQLHDYMLKEVLWRLVTIILLGYVVRNIHNSYKAKN